MKKELYRGKLTDEELAARGYRWVWIFWSVEPSRVVRWRGRVARFRNHLFETDERAFAEVLLNTDGIDEEGIKMLDAHGEQVHPESQH